LPSLASLARCSAELQPIEDDHFWPKFELAIFLKMSGHFGIFLSVG
jgi:hypothetical protein